MLDMPPPLPRCSRISRVSRMLVRTSNTINVYANHMGMVGFIPLEGHSSGPTIAGARPSRTAGHGVGSAHRVLAIPDDRGELLGVQAGAADQGAVHVGQGHDRRDVRRLHRTAVLDPD